MASAEAVAEMAKQPPPDFVPLSTVVARGVQPNVNVIGYVVDFMQPAPSRGTDMQMTFSICDKSSLPLGLRIKYFKKNLEDFPSIRNVGDVVALTGLKMNMYRGELVGLSSYFTENIVFPNDSIVSPDFRHRFAAHGEFLHHTRTTDNPPSIHIQQWAISLKAHRENPATDRMLSRPIIVPSQANEATNETSTVPSLNPRPRAGGEKFSLIKNVTGGDRDGGNRMGNFYDLAGEVVKMFFNISLGILDLYFTDYTVNSMLPDRRPEDLDENGRGRWQGPSGKMTIHLELYPPHATWAHGNIREGQFVFLQNVRIKWNQRGLGTELEGNIWADRLYGDRVYISRLANSHPRYVEIQARKTSYLANVAMVDSKMAKRKKKRNRNAKRQKMGSANLGTSAAVDDADADNESDVASETENTGQGEGGGAAETKNGVSAPSKKLNPNVECLFPDVPMSTFDEIINNPHRWFTNSTGEKIESPFINVKHRVRVRITDYFPHSLKDFTYRPTEAIDTGEVKWQWRFWLVLEAGDSHEDDSTSINVLLHGDNARNLLQMHPCDFSRNAQRLQELEQTLFLMWGELGEQKKKFLDSHPKIKADDSFSAVQYNIKTDNRAFDTCIEEWGQKVNSQSEGDEHRTGKNWLRVYGMFGTRIKR